MLFSSGGKAVRFDENDVRPMGRNAHGVRGMMLEKEQRVISMLVAEDEEQSVLTATENGYGKRTPIVEYTRHGRGTKGMIAIQQTERNGKVVAAALVRPDDEVMLISTGGVLIRTQVKSIREMSRSTQGVTLINLGEGEKLAGLERVVEPTTRKTSSAPSGAASAMATADDREQRPRPAHRAAIDALDREILATAERARRARAGDRRAEVAAAPRIAPSARRRCWRDCRPRIAARCPNEAVTGVFRQVMSACLALEQPLRVAYLGPAGTFTHAAVGQAFRPVRRRRAVRDDRRGVSRGRKRADRLRRRAGREFDRGRGRPHARPHVPDAAVDLRRDQAARPAEPAVERGVARRGHAVYSHAQSLAQCVQWLARAPARGRARRRREQRRGGASRRRASRAPPRSPARSPRRSTASPCSRRTSRTSRTTRRASGCLGRSNVPPSGRDETSLVMSAPNRPGAVHALLEPFAKHGVSMTRFESRPARTGLWEYLFFVDLVGHRDDPTVAAALAELRQNAPFLKLLGSYPAAIIRTGMSAPTPFISRVIGSVARGARVRAPHRALRARASRSEELAREFGLDARSIVKLASNENPRGPSAGGARGDRQRDRGAVAAIPTATASRSRRRSRSASGSTPTTSCSATAATTCSSS